MIKNQEKVSKLISFWLRHDPKDGSLQIDEFGWVKIEDLILALKQRSIETSKEELIKLNDSFEKVRWRFDLDNSTVKATHGHSIEISQALKPESPKGVLYHGTATKYLNGIIENGIKSKHRQFVHLSDDIEMAYEIAKRHGKPFIIEIQTQELLNDGFEFYRTEQNVWLTKDLPVKYIDFKPWHFNSEDKRNEGLFNELKKEISENHILFNKFNSLEIFGYHLITDDVLLRDFDSNELYVTHATWSGQMEDNYFSITYKYINLENWIAKRLIQDQANWYL